MVSFGFCRRHCSNRLLFFPPALLLIVVTTISKSKGQSQVERTDRLLNTISEFHFSPRPVNDAFSALVFDDLMETLDPQSLIFSKEDVEKLQAFRNKIDDDLDGHSTVFIEQLQALYVNKLNETETLIAGLESTPINLIEKDSLQLSDKHRPVTENERKRKWIQWIKLQILWEVAYMNGAERGLDALSTDSLEHVAQQIIQREQCHFKTIHEAGASMEDYVFDSYLQSISSAFDPHTNYFNSNDEAKFQTLISKEAPSFGFEAEKNKDGEIEIITILPGGPAWNSNELNEGDIILSVQGNGRKPLDLNCISLEEATGYLLQADLTSATFRIKKVGGEYRTVTLKKELVTLFKNSIQSHILSGKRRIGYMYLPTFYEGKDGAGWLPNGCANDIGKELIRLEKEKIDGLILDLRDNGGGSMLEALRLAGIFIDFGALSVAKYKNLEPETMKDMSRGMAYTGPLLVLVNEFSASASELFSACIQDHKRGVIVGSKTFGKSTIQQVVPLKATEKGGEFVKLTIGQFYRITGESIQQVGVIPDIALPSAYSDKEIGERFYPSCLPAGTVDKKTYYTPWKTSASVVELQKLSDERVSTDSAFIAIVNSEQKKDSLNTIPLDVDGFRYYFEKLKKRGQATADTEFKASDRYDVVIPSYRDLKLETESLSQKMDEEIRQWISEDIYISEAYNIITDIINLSSTK
ncbi:MAG: hypothetical protein GC178_15965 [Flavobacteriales bacterium]|nr:hypothetical protein [Flavobacteriales bacterium]